MKRTFFNNKQWTQKEGAYALIQSTKPQSLAHGLNDSPAGLLHGSSNNSAAGAIAAARSNRGFTDGIDRPLVSEFQLKSYFSVSFTYYFRRR
jgi:hypothetical protein